MRRLRRSDFGESRWGGPWLALVALLVGSTALRLVGVRYGLPFPLLNPDERNIVPRAWAMKEMLRAIFAPGLTVEAVGELLDRLLARLSRCRPRPFIRLGRTIRKHRQGILAARRLKLSNARAEALNNKAKLIVRRAYGFHSAQAALALIHLTCGPITLTLPHEHPFA